MPWVDDNKIWFNPAYIHACCAEIVKERGIDQIKKERNYKKLVESFDLSLTALTLYSLNRDTHELPLIQIPKKDPPDGYIGQQSIKNPEDFDISVLELTRFEGKNSRTLLKQLLESDKVNPNYNKYGSHYVLLIKIEDNTHPDYEEVNNFLVKHKINYAVWALEITQSYPDTTAKLTILNPNIQVVEVNIGEVALMYKQQKIAVAYENNRAGSKKRVRKEITNHLDKKYFDKNFGWLL